MTSSRKTLAPVPPRSLVYFFMKRSFDILFSLAILTVTSPLFFIVTIGILLASKGPIFFRAHRANADGKAFVMLKFRTMHVGSERASAITGPSDTRIFPFGRLLRKSKLDELPQFVNVLKGEMSVVGPRPEDHRIVVEHYTPMMLQTLEVKPGITSPGAVFGYAHGDFYLDNNDPEKSYVEALLPRKLAVERAYLDRRNIILDTAYVVLTLWAILMNAWGFKVDAFRTETEGAQRYL